MCVLAPWSQQEAGLVARIFTDLFEELDRLRRTTPVGLDPPECFLSAVEVYNEGLVDLLEPAATNLAVREDYVRGMFVGGALEVAVDSGVGMWECRCARAA